MKSNEVLPNLIIPGAGKSGTSSLHQYLDIHPDIYMSEFKEPQYFFFDERYKKKSEWYSSLFVSGKDSKYRGESSTSYLSYPLAIERMKKDLLNPKFIVLLRNPINRIISHYNWLKSKGLEYKSIKKAVNYDADYTIDENYHIKKHGKCYLQFSLYGKWIALYYEAFGFDNIHIITSESLKQNPVDTLNSCFTFLNLKNVNEIISETEHNITIYKKIPKLDAVILHYLYTVNNTNTLLRIKEKIVPEAFKEIYWKFHTKLSTNRIHTNRPKVSLETTNWLRDLLSDDVKKLKKITGMEFKEWTDFL